MGRHTGSEEDSTASTQCVQDQRAGKPGSSAAGKSDLCFPKFHIHTPELTRDGDT